MLGSFGIVLLCLPVAQVDLAGVILPGEARSSALQHEDFRKYAAAGRWDDALAEYNGLLARPVDLAPLSPRYLLQARWLAHRDLALLPEEVRQRLSEQRQPAAQRALDSALSVLDATRLRRIVEEQFGTPAALKAIDTLGDLAFERGDFETAACWYRLLLPGSPGSLTLPVPLAESARTRAKVLLTRLFAHKRLGARAALSPSLNVDLAAFAREHPDAAGKLAGREGKYHEILAGVARDRLLEAPPAEGVPTFGGSPGRFGPLPVEEYLADRLSILTRKPFLRLNLETRQSGAGPETPFGPVNPRSHSSMALYPALGGEHLYLADSRYLTGIDLSTGRSRELFDVSEAIPGLTPERTFPMPDHFRATLTLAEGHLLARFGTVPFQETSGDVRLSPSVVVCFRPGSGGGVTRQWMLRSEDLGDAQMEGAPLVHQGRVYLAATRLLGDRSITSLVCVALESVGKPTRLWTRDVCETRELASGKVRRLHHLLTLAGPNVVYCSHSGAIVAVDAISGQRAWAHRYRSASREIRQALPGSEALPPVHDLSPPLFSEGMVYVAPNDCETLSCLDPWTGAIRWQRDGIQAVHLLGTWRDRLIFTTPDGLRAVDARTGADTTGWMLPDAGRLAPLGRGQLVGDVVLWPTLKGVFAVRAEDGHLVDGPAHLDRVPAGNLLYQDGVLVSSGRSTLTIFKEPERRPVEIPPASEKGPQSLHQEALDQGRAGEPRRAAEIWLTLLDAPDAATTTILDERRRPWPAATLALHHLDHLRRGPQGEAIQAMIEERATSSNPLARFTRDAIQERLATLERDQPEAQTLWRVLLRHGEGSQRSAAVRALEKLRPRSGASTLPLEWGLGAAVDLNFGERLIPGVDQFLTVQPESVGGRIRLRTGEEAAISWQLELGFVPDWAVQWEEQILLAGPRGLASVRLDGKCLWQAVSNEKLDAYQCVGERLFVRVAGGRLRAVDVYNGAVLWEFAPTAAGLPLDPPYASLARDYGVGETRLLVRTAGCWNLLDAATGRVLRQEAAPPALGPDQVLPLDNRRGLVVAERESVSLYDLTNGALVWTWAIPAKTTSRLEPIRLLGVGSTVWVQVPVNIGHEIHRLELRTGKQQSDLPRLIRAEPLNLAMGQVLGDMVYLVEGDAVVARSRLDGAVRWRRALPVGPAEYRVERIGDEVVILPAASRVAGGKFHCLLGTLEWKMGYPPAAGGLVGVPVLRLDATTGKPRQVVVPGGLPSLNWNAQPALEPYLRPEVLLYQRSAPCDFHLLPAPSGWRLVWGSRSWNLKSDPRP